MRQRRLTAACRPDCEIAAVHAHLEDLVADVGAGPLEGHAVALNGHHGGVEAGAEGGGADALAHDVGACAGAAEEEGAG